MKTLTDEEWNVIKKVLASSLVKLEIGAENWSLTEEDEALLWVIIKREGTCEQRHG